MFKRVKSSVLFFLFVLFVQGAFANQKIAVFMGTFDPPHFGHYELAELAQQVYEFDQIYILPNFSMGDKPNATPFQMRKALVRVAFNSIKNVQFANGDIDTALEITADDHSFIFEYIHELHPEAEIHHIVGSDVINRFKDNFVSVKLPYTRVIVANRKGEPLPDQEFLEAHKDVITILKESPMEMSSSKTRKDIGSGNNSRLSIDPSVKKIIKRYGLYLSNCLDSLTK